VKSVEAAADLLGLQDQDLLTQRIAQLQAELKDAKRRAREGGARRLDPAALAATAVSAPGGYRVLLASVDVEDIEALKELSNQLRKELGAGVIGLVRSGGAPDILVVVDGVDASVANAGSIVSAGAVAIGGRGGGKPNMGQGRGAEGGDAALAIQAMAAALGLTRSGADA
jgi:alanyl-tRNA synthetase